jgi:hypothetical protein
MKPTVIEVMAWQVGVDTLPELIGSSNIWL